MQQRKTAGSGIRKEHPISEGNKGTGLEYESTHCSTKSQCGPECSAASKTRDEASADEHCFARSKTFGSSCDPDLAGGTQPLACGSASLACGGASLRSTLRH